jgi:hypothetical protein
MLILCPSRGRPGNAARLADAVRHTATGPVELLFLVDDDDPRLGEYRAVPGREYREAQAGDTPAIYTVAVEIGEPGWIGGILNHAVRWRAHTVTYVGFLGDDHVPRTLGWDETLTGAVDGMGGGFAYGDDLIHGPNLPTAIVMSSDIPRTLGCMVPGGLGHLFIDNAWKDLGEQTGHLAYRPDVVIEHMHPLVGKAADDGTYARVNSSEAWQAGAEAYKRWREVDMARDAEWLRAVWA